MAGGGARAVHLLTTVIRTSKVQRILNPTVLGRSGCCLRAPTCYFSVNSTSSSVKIPAPGDTKDVDHFPCLHKSV